MDSGWAALKANFRKAGQPRPCKHQTWVQACSSPPVCCPSSEQRWCLLTACALGSQETEKLAYLQGDSMQPAVSGAQRQSPER